MGAKGQRREVIARHGQPYVDRPVLRTHVPAGNLAMMQSVAMACGNPPPRILREQIGWERVHLDWKAR